MLEEGFVSQLEYAQFRATGCERQAFGSTPQAALKALMKLLPVDASGPIVIWPYNRADAYFSEAQQDRLRELKGREDTLTETERDELEHLVEAAFDATIARTKALPIVKS
jgi:hypothetical protein